jgi:hypothetical protein
MAGAVRCSAWLGGAGVISIGDNNQFGIQERARQKGGKLSFLFLSSEPLVAKAFG